jgi:phage terminase large subunit GpA-like protein
MKKRQVFFNTTLGELWEERELTTDEHIMLRRCEDYDGEVPKNALVLALGADVQGDRIEYEIVGYGRNRQSYGIKYGIIPLNPRESVAWSTLEEIIKRPYKFSNGSEIKISLSYVDSGYLTEEVYKQTQKIMHLNVFPIKGITTKDRRFVSLPSIQEYSDGKKIKLYTINVNEGKDNIFSDIGAETPDISGFMHYPTKDGYSRNYDYLYFRGLLSEEKIMTVNGTQKWVKRKDRERNEPLDIRNYANAAYECFTRSVNIDFDELEKRYSGGTTAKHKFTVKSSRVSNSRVVNRKSPKFED